MDINKLIDLLLWLLTMLKTNLQRFYVGIVMVLILLGFMYFQSERNRQFQLDLARIQVDIAKIQAAETTQPPSTTPIQTPRDSDQKPKTTTENNNVVNNYFTYNGAANNTNIANNNDSQGVNPKSMPQTDAHEQARPGVSFSQPSTQGLSEWLIDLSPESEKGSSWTATTSGRFQFCISGAFSPWPYNSYPGYQGWKTEALIFRGDRVNFKKVTDGVFGPLMPDASMGWGVYSRSPEEAETNRQKPCTELEVSAGSTLTFVASDHQGAYSGNRGALKIRIHRIIPY